MTRLLEPLVAVYFRAKQCILVVCYMLLLVLCMPLRALVGLEAARGAEMYMSRENAVPRAVWALKTALFGP